LYLSIVNGKGGRLQVEAGTVVVKAAEVQYYLANVWNLCALYGVFTI